MTFRPVSELFRAQIFDDLTILNCRDCELQRRHPGSTSITMDGAYQYNAQPRAVPQKPKYRPDEQRPSSTNIMWDRRVYRGSNFAPQTLPASAGPDPVQLQKEAERRRRQTQRSKQIERAQPTTPPPVLGRSRMNRIFVVSC